MEEIYVNVDYDKSGPSRPSAEQAGPRSSDRRFYRGVVLGLGLLCVGLLAGLVGLGVQGRISDRDAAAELSVFKANVTELLQDSREELSSVTDERDKLREKLLEMSRERDRLESLSRKLCPAGWTKFSWSCYSLSRGSDSWTNGRRDCQNKGADLVIVTSEEEQTFLSGFSNVDTWIGLSEQSVWKWVDGAPLFFTHWNKGEPNNAAEGGEDCAEMAANTGHRWNDLHCGRSLHWICEKNV